MSLLLVLGLFLFVIVMLLAGLLAWVLLQQYLLQIILSYRFGRVRLALEFGSMSRNLLSASVHNEGWKWHAGVQTRGRSRWKRSWVPRRGIQWRRLFRRLWSVWEHPKRSAWLQISRRLLREVYEELKFRDVVLKIHMGLPTYQHTGYLAAVAYPLNYTLFRVMGVFHPQVLPNFSKSGFGFESGVHFTLRGYQLLKPGYHFLNSPEIRDIVRNRFSKRYPRLAVFRRAKPKAGPDSAKGAS